MNPYPLLKTITFATCVTFFAPLAVSADSPDRKNKVSGQEIIDIYAGNTWLWSKGGSYWGKNGSFEAVWEGAVGVGKWYATNKGSLCYEATWKKEASDDGSAITRCWRHVKDSEGVLWKQDPENQNWYRPQKEISERVKRGNKIKAQTRKLRKKVGL